MPPMINFRQCQLERLVYRDSTWRGIHRRSSTNEPRLMVSTDGVGEFRFRAILTTPTALVLPWYRCFQLPAYDGGGQYERLA